MCSISCYNLRTKNMADDISDTEKCPIKVPEAYKIQ